MKLSNLLSLIISIAGMSVIQSCEIKNQNATSNIYQTGLFKLEYNNPELLVDLDAGFKAVPMPMDFDGDGDFDLLISESACYAESGIFYFENISGNVEMPIFRYGMKVSFERFRQGLDGSLFQVSEENGNSHVITPDKVREKLLIYKNVPQNVFWDDNEILLSEKGYEVLHNFRDTQWKMIDFDGDGIRDLVCSAQNSNPIKLRGSGAKERLENYKSASKTPQLFVLINSGSDEKPVYEDPFKISKENGDPLSKGVAIKPLFADFDNDGDNDFIGIRSEDNYFIYFENTGTQFKYKFTDGKLLKHKDKAIQMFSRAAIHSSSIDWNKDGFVDIIAGDEDGKISFMKNTGEIINGIPEFLPPQFFQQEARFVDFGALAAPRVFDWDGDGLDDIISGNGIGSIGFIKNLGGYLPKWAAPELLQVNGRDIRILPEDAPWGYTTIDVGDWNRDELPDILVNHHHGNVLWYENIGTRKNPILSEAKPIEVNWNNEALKPEWVPGTSEGNELLAPWRTSPYIMDFNQDGLKDLVMLDYQGYLAVYPRYLDENDDLQLSHPQRNFVSVDGEPIVLNQRTGSSSGRLKITFSDWDGDGLKDLIVSSKPAVDWMKNMGMKDDKMVLQYMGRILSKTLMGHTDGPVVSDWNKDGIPDLLVGTENGVFYYWERRSYSITTTMTTEGIQAPANYKYFKR